MTESTRTELLSELVRAKVIRCPADGCPMDWKGTAGRCAQCGQTYPVIVGGLLDMRPAAPRNLGDTVSRQYRDAYGQLFCEHSVLDHDAIAWGAPEVNPQGWVAQKRTQAKEMVGALADERRFDLGVACDLSAGAGYAARELAQKFGVAIHCDLSVKDLSYAIAFAERNKIANVAFVRADLLQPPFHESLGAVVCLDTLIYGKGQMECALGTIHSVLGPGGCAALDFHNWWHNPLRRIGLMRENFPAGGSLGHREAQNLAQGHGLTVVRDVPWRGELLSAPLLRRTIGRLAPPTRHGFIVRRDQQEVS